MRAVALNDVVAVITGAHVFDVIAVDQKRAMVTRSLFGPAVSRSWLHESPAESVEALAHSGLWPMEWMDSACGVRWWCAGCGGYGVRQRSDGRGAASSRYTGEVVACSECDDGIGSSPPTIPALAAVASMGVANLRRVVELARVIEPATVVVWRVMKPEAIQEHHRECEERRNDSGAALVFSREARDDEWSGILRERDGRKRWQEECPYHGWFGSGGDDDPQGVHRAWPALRELHALGVHLVGHTPRSGDAPGHVVIGVEALP